MGLALLAVVVIPIASGAPGKTYTLTYPSNASTPPAAAATSANQTLCVGTSYTQVKLTLKNTAKTVTLGSADITFPNLDGKSRVTLDASVKPQIASATATYTLPAAADATLDAENPNKVKIRQLSLPKDASITVTVALSATTVGAAADVAAVVKQSNDFNDSGGDANQFDPAPAPKVTVQSCVTTVGGKVYLDKDTAGDFDTGVDLTLPGWNVSLWNTTTSQQVGATQTTLANGEYLFTDVPTGPNADYKVCATPPSGTWEPTNRTANTLCQSEAPSNPTGIAITALSGQQTSPAMDFASRTTTSLDNACADPFEGTGLSSDLRYRAQFVASGTGCKTGTVVMYTYKNGGEFVAALNPTSTGGATYQVVEYIRWDGFGSGQNPVTLRYDDVAPYDGVDYASISGNDGYRVMKQCTADPRPGKDDLPVSSTSTDLDLPAGNYSYLLPSGETTCMLRSIDSAEGVYEAWTYSSLDGVKNNV